MMGVAGQQLVTEKQQLLCHTMEDRGPEPPTLESKWDRRPTTVPQNIE